MRNNAMPESNPTLNRRQYPRYKAPICYCPAPFFSARKPMTDIGPGGMRIYSDDKFKIGKRLEIGIFLPDDSILTITAKVVWQDPLPDAAAAKYDVGLQFLDMPKDGLQRLQEMLKEHKDTEV